jgi:hypothetical protein
VKWAVSFSAGSRQVRYPNNFVTARRNRSSGFLVEVPQLPKKEAHVSILWIVLIVVLVLALLGFVGRGF